MNVRCEPQVKLLVLAIYGSIHAAAVQAVGPGPIPVPLNVTSGSTTVVGNSTLTATGYTFATNVTGGTLTLDPSAGTSGGMPITVQSVYGFGLLANGTTSTATINALSGTNVSGSGTVLAAFGGGGAINATGVAVTLNASSSGGGNAVVAQNGGQIALNGGSVDVNSKGAIALGASGVSSASGSPSNVMVSGSTVVTTSGVNDVGVYMHRGGIVSLPDNYTLNINGQGSTGLVVDASSVPTGPSGLTITMTGASGAANGSTGVLAVRGATLSLQGLTVQGADVGAGVVARAGDTSASGYAGSSASVTLTNSTINVSRSGYYSSMSLPWYATQIVDPSGTSTSLTPGSGTPPVGLLAMPVNGSTLGATSTITAIGSTVNVNASGGFGAYAGARVRSGLNSVILNGSTVAVSGSGAYSLGADLNGYISATNSIIRNNGGAAALYLISGGDDVPTASAPLIELNQSTVTATGAGTRGVRSLNYSTLFTNTVRMNGGSLTSEQGNAIEAYGGPLVMTVSNGNVAGGAALLRAFDTSSIDLTASSNSILGGDAIAGPTSRANISLLTGSQWTGAAQNINNATVDGTSTWNVSGNSQVREMVTNQGLVAFTPPTAGAFKSLTATNYAGGGTLRVNTYLGADGSPSDRLILNGGTTTGTTGIDVRNAGGAGALTTLNGILVVDAVNGGTTSPGAFTQSGRAVAGVYEYRLFRGALDGSNPQAWYLRSEQSDPPPPPPGPPDPSVIVPLLRPEIGAYLANQRLAAGFLVHSLHDRLGEPQWTEQQTFGNDDARRGAGWLRLVGKDIGSRSRDGNFDVDSTVWLLQGGGDVARWSVFQGDDRLHLGGMIGYNWGSSTGRASGNPFHADSDVQGVNVGVYGTWFQNDKTRLGWYTDLWAQYGWFTNHVNGQLLPSVRYDSQVLALSAEGGYAWFLRAERDWVAEPQAQIIYVHGYQGSITEPTGTTVDSASGSGVITRLGVRMHRTWIDDAGRRFQPYLTLNWWHDSVDNAIAFNQVSMRDLYPQNRYEVKLGLDVQGRKGWTGWSNVGWQFGSQSYHAFIGRLGAKYTW